MSFYDILRPQVCPICNRKHLLRKHGTYRRYFCDLATGIQSINILRYYCSTCGGTISFLPSFALPRRQFSAAIISICLQLIFVCGVSLKRINRAYPCVSSVLAGSWLKRWYYSSRGIISVMRNYFGFHSQMADVCSYHTSKYITAESLEAFFIVSDFVIGDELYNCSGTCSIQTSFCYQHYCSGILEEIQKEFFKLPFCVELL